VSHACASSCLDWFLASGWTSWKEGLTKIVADKQADLKQYGEVLWAFKYFPESIVEAWQTEIQRHPDAAVLVFCGESIGNRDPCSSAVVTDTHRQDSSKSRVIRVKGLVTGSRRRLCAFVVRKIERWGNPLTKLNCPRVEFWRDGQWTSGPFRRHRPELLAKPAVSNGLSLVPTSRMVTVEYVLRLKSPYVTWVGDNNLRV
jgi:hypothetical protein